MTSPLWLHSGRRVSLTSPAVADVALGDIASVLVSQCCEPGEAAWGLLHDATEAYLGDVVRPLKALPALAGYRALEAAWMRTIAAAFGVPGDLPASVVAADDLVLAWERRDLVDGVVTRSDIPGARLEPLCPTAATRAFLDRATALGLTECL